MYIYVYFQAIQKTTDSESNSVKKIHKHPQWDLAENEKAKNKQAERNNIMESSRSTKLIFWGHQNLHSIAFAHPPRRPATIARLSAISWTSIPPVEPG